jgi:hypothetical protein
MAFVFWGGTANVYVPTGWFSGINTPTYDDNRHAQSFTDNDAGDGSNTQPRSYQDLDGSGDGRWGYYYKPANSIWLRDGTKHLVRFELSRLPSYPNAAGNYPYLLKAWVRTGTQATAYGNVNADYTAAPPNLYRAIFLSPTMHSNLAKIMVGFAEATGWATQRVEVANIRASFKRTQDVPAMPTDYVAYFPMSEGSGTTVTDSNGTIATLYNGANWVTGCAKCPAINFDGNNDVLHSNNAPTIAPTTSGTVAAWYYMPTRGDTDDGLVHKGDDSGASDESYSLQLTGQRRLGLVIRHSNTETVSVDTAITVGTTWHHVAATWDANELLIYIDGELKGRTVNTNHYSAQASSGGLNIGAQAFDTGTHLPSDAFRGRISRVAIYNRALTALEVAAMAVAP